MDWVTFNNSNVEQPREDKMDISKFDKAEVLAALYNNAKAQGLGVFQYEPDAMTIEEAEAILATGQTYFDYVKGRVLKINLSNSDMRTVLYNRDNGFHAAEDILAALHQS